MSEYYDIDPESPVDQETLQQERLEMEIEAKRQGVKYLPSKREILQTAQKIRKGEIEIEYRTEGGSRVRTTRKPFDKTKCRMDDE